MEAHDPEGEGVDELLQDGQQEGLGDGLDGADELVLGDLVDDVDQVDALFAVEVALVDGVDAQETGPTAGVRLAALADGDLDRPRFGRRRASAPVRRGLPQPVEVAVRQPRQTLEAEVAEDLELALQYPPRRRAAQPAEDPVDLREQTDVGDHVAPLKRPRRAAAAVLDAPGCPVLADQPRQLRSRQPRHLAQKLLQQPLRRLVQSAIAEPHQRPTHELVGARAIGRPEVHRPIPLHESADLFERPQPFGIECQDHPPMIPNPDLSGSCHVGSTPCVQAHVTWDRTPERRAHRDPGSARAAGLDRAAARSLARRPRPAMAPRRTGEVGSRPFFLPRQHTLDAAPVHRESEPLAHQFDEFLGTRRRLLRPGGAQGRDHLGAELVRPPRSGPLRQ